MSKHQTGAPLKERLYWDFRYSAECGVLAYDNTSRNMAWDRLRAPLEERLRDQIQSHVWNQVEEDLGIPATNRRELGQ